MSGAEHGKGTHAARMRSLSLATVLAGVGASLRGSGGHGAIHSSRRPRVRLPWLKPDPKRLVNQFMAGGSSATVIESGLIAVIVSFACITAWMHVSASLNIPFASASTTVSVETTGSVRSRELHRALRTRRLHRSEKRLYGTGCPAQVRIGSITRIEDRYALSRSCAAFPPRLSLSLQQGQ
jgi:Flp pilus assembly pilin Flp